MALKADSAQYYLGYIWWILEPIFFVAIFYLVFDVILKSNRADFLVFLMCGKLPFIWFSKSVVQASNSILASKGLIGKVNIPKTLFPMSIIQEGVYKQGTVFLLLLCVVVGFGYSPGINWLWLIPIIFTQYLMIVSCGLIGSILVCYVRDLNMLISLGMTFLLFASGIFWDVRNLSDQSTTDLVLTVNPMAFILDAYRQVLMFGSWPDPGHLFLLTLVFALLVAFAMFIMHRASQALALRAITS